MDRNYPKSWGSCCNHHTQELYKGQSTSWIVPNLLKILFLYSWRGFVRFGHPCSGFGSSLFSFLYLPFLLADFLLDLHVMVALVITTSTKGGYILNSNIEH